MHSDMPAKRTIVYHGSKEALGPATDVILTRLGYRLVLPETFAQMQIEDPARLADLLVVDDRRLEEAEELHASQTGTDVPMVLLTGRGAVDSEDPRIVGAVRRPAGMHDLYRLIQQIFEDTPRSTPRIATQLAARFEKGDRSWEGRVLSLSENGCLIRSSESIALGQRFRLEFALPQRGPISLDAEAAYQLMPDLGLVFSAVAPAQRESIERFVTDTLLAA